MIRLVIFIFGLVLFLVGAASNFKSIPIPFDFKSVALGVGTAVFSLDVIFMVAGVFLILIAWVFTRLNQ
jgi:hypothetical protein